MSSLHHNQSNYEILLMEYAAGTLDMAQMLVVSAHLSLSPQARKIVRDCECVGGALIEKRCEPVPMSESSLDNVLSRLDHKAHAPQTDTRERRLPEDFQMPFCIEDMITCRSRLRWKSFYPGIDGFALPLECRKSKAHVFRFRPGISTPAHRHEGLEITLVLDGAISDEDGLYEQGSLLISDAEDKAHKPMASVDQGCVCLTVFSGPVHFTGAFARLLNPFFRF